MSRRAILAIGACLLGAAGVWLWTPPGDLPGSLVDSEAAGLPAEPPPDPVLSDAPPRSSRGVAPALATREEPPRDNLLYRRPPPEVIEQLEQSDVFQQRLVEAERQRAAAQRFSQGVEDGSFEAEDVNRSVVAFFETMRLEPVLEDDGTIFGLEIRSVEPGSPLLEAGFAERDVITRLNGTRLADPADVPRLLVELERDLTLCVDRDGREICERISLD